MFVNDKILFFVNIYIDNKPYFICILQRQILFIKLYENFNVKNFCNFIYYL
jgi:hypothetical protein